METTNQPRSHGIPLGRLAAWASDGAPGLALSEEESVSAERGHGVFRSQVPLHGDAGALISGGDTIRQNLLMKLDPRSGTGVQAAFLFGSTSLRTFCYSHSPPTHLYL